MYYNVRSSQFAVRSSQFAVASLFSFSKSKLFYRLLKKVYHRINHYRIILRDFLRVKKKFCIICGHKVGKFLPGGISEEIFTKHHIIGGGYRDNCTCPYCGSGDRSRWQYYVLKKYSGILEPGNCRVLHFAAEKYNSDLIRTNKKCEYFTADIEKGRGDYVLDMTDMKGIKSHSFDYFIANHVLEHIIDEAKAISEIKRILKADGKIILSFPICTDIKTYEDNSITTEEERLKTFGQIDHVRLYGTDFKERLENYGLNVKIFSPKDELTPEGIEKFGFISDDISIFCTVK